MTRLSTDIRGLVRDQRIMSGPGYDLPIPLRDMPVGSRWFSFNDGAVWRISDQWETGTVMWHGQASIEVWVDRARDTTRYQHEVPVFYLDEQDLSIWPELVDALTEQYEPAVQALAAGIETHIKRTDTDMAQTDPKVQAKALLARWNFQLSKLEEQLGDDSKAAASATRARIENIINEAKGMRIIAALPLPNDALLQDPVFESLILAQAQAAAGEPVTSDGDSQDAAAASEGQSGNSNSRQAARTSAVAKHKAAVQSQKVASGEARPKAPAKSKDPQPCLDGCGALVAGNFAMGHDAKLKSLLLKIERGERDITEVPDVAQDIIVFRRGEVVKDLDGAGNVKAERQTYELIAAPVRVPGRPEIRLTSRADIPSDK